MMTMLDRYPALTKIDLPLDKDFCIYKEKRNCDHILKKQLNFLFIPQVIGFFHLNRKLIFKNYF